MMCAKTLVCDGESEELSDDELLDYCEENVVSSLCDVEIAPEKMESFAPMPGSLPVLKRKKRSVPTGTANAARVSRGSKVDTWSGLDISTPARHANEHITATIVLYFTIAGGVPSEADVIAAIDDMEQLYDSCTASGRLADAEFNFMTNELTVKDVMDIKKKITEQPPA